MTHDADRLAFWNLRAAPFRETRNPRVFFESPPHEEAVSRMRYLVRQSESCLGLLSGEVGAGKSLVASVLARQLDEPDRIVAYVPTGHYEFPQLLAEIIGQLYEEEVEFDTYDEHVLLRAFTSIAEQALLAPGRRLLVILDEAQELADETLERVRGLTNLGKAEEALPVTVLLVGHTSLHERVQRNPQLDQRIDQRYHLGPLEPDETSGLLQHRLLVAGHPDGNLFDEACIERLAEATGGIPRLLCRYARLAMDNSHARGATRVGVDSLEEIVADQHLQQRVT